jgi:hypothetical protein
MALNNLYLLQSGLTGWEDSSNTTASLYKRAVSPVAFLGVGVNYPSEIFHVAASGSLSKIRLEQDYYKTTESRYQASLNFTDYREVEMGSFGFMDLSTYDLTISNNATTGGPNVNIALPGGVGFVAGFTSGGKMGLRTANPLATFHLSEPGNSDLALIGTSTNSNEFVIKNQGLVGVGTNQPHYRLHVTGDTFAHQYLWEQRPEPDSSLVSVDLDGTNFRTIYLTGHEDAIHKFTTFNGADTNVDKEIKAVTVRIEQSGEATTDNPNNYRTLDFENSIRFLGEPPTGIPSGKVGVLAFNSFGPDVSDTVAVYREEGDDITGPPGPPGTPATGMTSEGFGNRIIGGEFATNPWQRGISFPNVQDGQYTADRFSFVKSGDPATQFTVERDAGSGYYSAPDLVQIGFPIQDSDAGSGRCLKIEPHDKLGYQVNLRPNIDDNDIYCIEQKIEGFNWRYLAENHCYLSFFAKTDQTGAGCVYLQNEDRSTSFVSDYLITRSGEWQEHLVPIPASPTGDRVHNMIAFGNCNITVKEVANVYQKSSLRFSPVGYLETCFHDDFRFGPDGTGDFTIEAILKFDTLNQTGSIYSNNTTLTAGDDNTFYWEGSPHSSIYKFGVVVSGEPIGNFDIPSSVIISPLSWYHVALTRSGGMDFNLYVSGELSPTTLHSYKAFSNEAAPIRIGTSGNGGDYNGWIDEYRISTGIKYDAPFNPPNFSVKEDDTVLLLHSEGEHNSTQIYDSAYEPVPTKWDYRSGVGVIVGWTLGAGKNYSLPTEESCGTYYLPNKWVTGTYFSYDSTYSASLCSGDFSLSAPNLSKSLDYSYVDRPYQLELELCQRYYEKQIYDTGHNVSPAQAISVSGATGITIDYVTTKRVPPNISLQGDFGLNNADYTAVDKVEHFEITNKNIFKADAGAEVSGHILSAGNMTNLSILGPTGGVIIDSEL